MATSLTAGADPETDEEALDSVDEGVEGQEEASEGQAEEADTSEQAEEGAEAAEASAEEGETDELVVQIGDEPPAEEEADKHAPAWVKDLRKNQRELVRQLRERDAEIAKLKGSAPQQAEVEVGAEPELAEFASADEISQFKKDWNAWNQRRQQADAKAEERRRVEDQQRAAYQARLDTYKKAAASLKVPDFQDAEETALELLNVTQQGIIVKGAARPELLVYALGKNPKKAKELAAITDPVDFTFAAARLEAQLKVTPRKQAPAPERKLNSAGSSASAVASDKRIEDLHKKAKATGDYTEYLAAKRAVKERRAA